MIATSFALLAFAAALAVGFYAGNELDTVLWRGIAVMLVCYVIGLILGSIAQRTIDEHTTRHAAENPIPDSIEDLPPSPNAAPTPNAEAAVG
ncbi:MAG: hypothetical protein AAGH92_06005 [Planctomycetota bacterium]